MNPINYIRVAVEIVFKYFAMLACLFKLTVKLHTMPFGHSSKSDFATEDIGGRNPANGLMSVPTVLIFYVMLFLDISLFDGFISYTSYK